MKRAHHDRTVGDQILKIVAIVQAHMGSHRLPGKVLRPIMGKPMLEHLISRLKLSKEIDSIVVATTNNERDREIIKLAERCGVRWFVGDEKDVLDRIVRAAEEEKADIVVRVTADNPLTDPLTIDRMIRQHKIARADYTWTEGMPVGIAAEVVSFDALKRVHSLTKKPYDREHVTTFIKENKELFKIQFLTSPHEFFRPEYRLTVDYEEDLRLMEEIFKRLYISHEIFSLTETIKLLDENPELREINVRAKLGENDGENKDRQQSGR